MIVINTYILRHCFMVHQKGMEQRSIVDNFKSSTSCQFFLFVLIFGVKQISFHKPACKQKVFANICLPSRNEQDTSHKWYACHGTWAGTLSLASKVLLYIAT